ncbi:mCG145465, isoform CRA_a, partial [Mus musculus]
VAFLHGASSLPSPGTTWPRYLYTECSLSRRKENEWYTECSLPRDTSWRKEIMMSLAKGLNTARTPLHCPFPPDQLLSISPQKRAGLQETTMKHRTTRYNKARILKVYMTPAAKKPLVSQQSKLGTR